LEAFQKLIRKAYFGVRPTEMLKYKLELSFPYYKMSKKQGWEQP